MNISEVWLCGAYSSIFSFMLSRCAFSVLSSLSRGCVVPPHPGLLIFDTFSVVTRSHFHAFSHSHTLTLSHLSSFSPFRSISPSPHRPFSPSPLLSISPSLHLLFSPSPLSTSEALSASSCRVCVRANLRSRHPFFPNRAFQNRP